MTPTAKTLEDVLLKAGGVLSLVADICMAQNMELSEQSRDGLARIALDAAGKVAFACDVCRRRSPVRCPCGVTARPAWQS